jgi:hypothetical protein
MKPATQSKIKTSKPIAKQSYRARQPSLFQSVHLNDEAKPSLTKEWKKLSRKTHGGAHANGNSRTAGKRKEFRPLDARRSLHLILKSDQAKGKYGLLVPRNQIFIAKTLEAKAKKFAVTIQSQANVGNHIHLKLRFRSKAQFQNFLRSITTLIARFVTGARKGKPFGRFWSGLAYTRVVTSAKEDLQLGGYIEANRIEAKASKIEREKFLEDFNAWVKRLSSA